MCSLILALIVAGPASGWAPAPTTPHVPVAAPAKLAASSVTKEVAAVRKDAKAMQAGLTVLAARRGADPAKAVGTLSVSVAALRKDVVNFKRATKAAPQEVKAALQSLDERLAAFSKTLKAIPNGRALSKRDLDGASNSYRRVLDGIDAVLGLLEPVVYR